MSKADKKSLLGFGFLLYFVYKKSGIKGVFWALKEIFISTWNFICLLNFTSVQITGDSILVALYATPITFTIVGFAFELLHIKKGKFGKYFGKLLFYLIGIPVSFILNLIAIVIFKI